MGFGASNNLTIARKIGGGHSSTIVSTNPYRVLLIQNDNNSKGRYSTQTLKKWRSVKVDQSSNFVSCHFRQGWRKPINLLCDCFSFTLPFKKVCVSKGIMITNFRPHFGSSLNTYRNPFLRGTFLNARAKLDDW